MFLEMNLNFVQSPDPKPKAQGLRPRRDKPARRQRRRAWETFLFLQAV